MDSRGNWAPRLLAGLQVGILGGLGILAWFVILSYWNFRAPWALVNLFSTSLESRNTWSFELSFSTFTGIAGHLVACGILGMLIGWVLPKPMPGSRVSVSGLTFGIVISLMTYEFIWRRFVQGLGANIAPASLLIAHMIFGMSLAQFPRFYLMLAPEPPAVFLLPEATTPAPDSEKEPPPPVDDSPTEGS